MNQRNVLMGNRILYNKSLERNHEIHQKKLKEIRSNLRGKSPLNVEINKKKKEQIQETKHTEIERENRILLEKITNIMQNKQLTMSMKRAMSPKSLNQTVRKKKLVQIAEENQFLLRRLQEKKSNYDIIQYEQQWVNTKNFMNTITGQPRTPKQQSYYGNSPSSSDNPLPLNNQSFSHSRNNSLNPIKRRSVKLNSTQLENNLYGQANTNQANQNVNNSFNGSLTSNFRIGQPRSASSRTNSAQVSKRNLSNNFNQRKEKIRLYKQVKVIGNIHFDVEVYMFDGKMMIVADEIEGDETKIIEIPQEEALNFLREECDNDLDSLVLRLRHANNQLFLIGTKKSRQNAQQNSASKSNGDNEELYNNNTLQASSDQQNYNQNQSFDNSKISQEQLKSGSAIVQSQQAGSSFLNDRNGSNKSYQTFQPNNGGSSMPQQNSNNNIHNSISENINRSSQQISGGMTQNNSNYRVANEDIHENLDEDNQESVNDQLQNAQNMKSVKEEENDYFELNSVHKSKGNTVSKHPIQSQQPSQQSHRNDRNEFEDNSPEKFVYEKGQEEEYEEEPQEYQDDEDEEEEEEEGELENNYPNEDFDNENEQEQQQYQKESRNQSRLSKKSEKSIQNSFILREEEVDI